MPLNAQIVRGGKPVQLPWGGFHITAMIYAIAFERKLARPNDDVNYPEQPQTISLGNVFSAVDYGIIKQICPMGKFTLEDEHHFRDQMGACDDLRLHPGDRLSFRRSHK